MITPLGDISREHPECSSCACGRRAPVQASPTRVAKGEPGHGPGTIAWVEHELAWSDYVVRYSGQSAERIAARGGFSYWELCDQLGRKPSTWRSQ